MLRVWHIQNIPNDPKYYLIDSPKAGLVLVKALIVKDLVDPEIESNAFGLEILREKKWEEWYSDEGLSIMDMIERE